MRTSGKRGPGRPFGAAADETRKSIVRAARYVFSQRGYDGATFKEIASCADLTRPAINHYFANKRVLYQEVVDRTNELVVEAGIERALRETSLAARISTIIDVAVEANSRNPSAAALLATDVLESQRHPELSPNGNDTVRAAREFLIWAVNDAIERGELTGDIDTAALIETLMVVACGLTFYAGYIGSHEQIDTAAESVRQLLKGELARLSPS
ncbi:TetR/AcrR family transcriptional regulator [Mycobacterium sp.]|uniref:TetR/AcrR family transcriptional regulator n=1 Tax=Mycobacterium sp. TaxID=1785 RepID=UPI003BAA1282